MDEGFRGPMCDLFCFIFDNVPKLSTVETKKKFSEGWGEVVSVLIEDPPIDVTMKGQPKTLGCLFAFLGLYLFLYLNKG